MKAWRKLTWVEIKLFCRDPLSVVFTLALPFFFLVVLNGVFGNEVETTPGEDVWRGVGPADFYVPAYVGLVMAATGVLSMPVRLASYRERGVLRRFRASGMPLAAILGSQVATALLVAVTGAVSIVVASALAYGTETLPADIWQFGIAFTLSALAFSAFGVLLGSVLPTSRSAQGAGLLLFFVMFLLSGAAPPRDVLTAPMRAVGDGLPLTWVVMVLQDTWLGFGWTAGSTLAVVALLAGSVVAAATLFRWE